MGSEFGGQAVPTRFTKAFGTGLDAALGICAPPDFGIAMEGNSEYQSIMTWAEVCEDKFLASLPYRIETDRWGYFVMSPPPRREQAELQGEIARLVGQLVQGGLAVTECPLETSEGVKAVDVAWVSRSRRASQLKQACYLIAPEICVEIESPSNSREELMERKRLCFEKGAQEFWLCNLNGQMTFFDPAGEIAKSKLCPAFPASVSLD